MDQWCAHPPRGRVQGVRVGDEERLRGKELPWDLQQGGQVPRMDPQKLQGWKLLKSLSDNVFALGMIIPSA